MCVVCQEGKNLVTVRFLVSAIMAPHLRAILAFIRMSIHHLRATLPLEVEDIPHLLTIYQLSNSHQNLPFLVVVKKRMMERSHPCRDHMLCFTGCQPKHHQCTAEAR